MYPRRFISRAFPPRNTQITVGIQKCTFETKRTHLNIYLGSKRRAFLIGKAYRLLYFRFRTLKNIIGGEKYIF